MPGNNITRAEAAERSAHLSVQHYDVSIDVTKGEETFEASTKVRFTCDKEGYSTFIDAVGKRIISATLNGAAIDTSSFDGESLAITDLKSENVLEITVEAIYSKSGEGLQRSVDPVDNEV